jgi:hypothetical protein
MAKIIISGTEHEVPDALAPILTQLQADNAKLLQDSKAALEALGKGKAEAEAKARAEAEAKQKAELAAAAKSGDIEKLTQLANQRLSQLSESFRDQELARAVESHPGLRKVTDPAERKALIDDVVSGIRAHASFDVDARRLAVKDADGRDATVSAVIDGYLKPRPYLRAADVPGGTGAGTIGMATACPRPPIPRCPSSPPAWPRPSDNPLPRSPVLCLSSSPKPAS